MDRKILGLSALTLMICSLPVTKTWADEEENQEAAAAATQNPNPNAAVGTSAAPKGGDDVDGNHDSDQNYASHGGFDGGPEDQFGPETVVVGH
ncbi:hypothetical protein RND71_026304 [Anisodus tanguticus]|uniref:Secreted protein n=1 Tax=Anisodus tanguticus TaxID=243964 RepID=A0AAE1RKP5_9SOLA|nr:hypothetical protein RND71_026304 [Anisodus tanguticus]